MKFLATFIVALGITLYIYLTSFLMHLVPWWLSPVILVTSIMLFLLVTTGVATK